MNPLLFAANATSYASHGIGPLSDAVSCVVTEEANGAYKLEMSLPASSAHLKSITPGVQIVVRPNPTDPIQPFRVKRVSRPLRGLVSISAEHICYDLAGVPVGAFKANNAAQAIGYMNSRRLGGEAFTFSTNLNVSNPMEITVPTSAWDLLGTGENTLLYCYGGELKFDRRTVQLLSARGANRGVVVRYGTNMTEMVYEEERDSFYTGVLPFWSDNDGTTVVGSVQNASGSFGFSKIMPLDLSSEYDDRPSVATLNAAGRSYITKEKIGQPVFKIRTTIVPPGSRGLQTLEDVRLFDRVTVEHSGYGISIPGSVVKTQFDVLRERFKEIEIGNRFVSIAQTIAAPTKRIADNAVTEKALANRSVGGGKIKKEAVKEYNLAQDSVTVNKIRNGSVTSEKIPNGAVTGNKILDGAISYAKFNGNLQVMWTDILAAQAVFATVITADKSVSCSTLVCSGTQFLPGRWSFIDGTGNSRTFYGLKEVGT